MDVQKSHTEAWCAFKNSSDSALELLDFQEETDASSNTGGWLSKIYTLTGHVRINGGQPEQIKLKVKKISEEDFLRNLAVEWGIFDQEIGFFDKCIPILLKKCPDLPVVKCHYFNLQAQVMIFEDLNELGYSNVVYNLTDLHRGNLKVQHIELAMKTLAKFHTASLGVDWAETFPELFQQDLMYERGGAAHSRKKVKSTVETSILPAAKLLFPGDKEILKSIEWLASDECYQLLTNLSKADYKTMNVLSHGDCWANNFLFKNDPETNLPIESKMIDFQICRYAPISRDLLFFLYISTSHEFRKQRESELLRVYTDAFNEFCAKMCRHERISYEQLWSEYDQSRLHGLIKALQRSPIVHVQDLFQLGENGRMTKEVHDQYFEKGLDIDSVTKEACRNEEFKQELCNMIEEINNIYKHFAAKK